LILAHEHPWDLTPEEARRLQEDLRDLVCEVTLPESGLRWVTGVDAAYSSGQIHAAAVTMDMEAMVVTEQAVASIPLRFPYIPGMLSFRETPAILQALARLQRRPDVLIVDGHGAAHPRRFGIACHLGVLLDLPTIGCAKSVLVGKAPPPALAAGSTSELRQGSELLGLALRTHAHLSPVYVSVGHRVDLPSAARVVLACSRGRRLPEPTRLAHLLAGRTAREGYSADDQNLLKKGIDP